MRTARKLVQLKKLKLDIEKSVQNYWLFSNDPRPEVKGFLGTGPFMLVGERPSTGKSGGRSLKRLYDLLVELNIENSHLTDVIKSREKVGAPYPSDMTLHKEIFDKEIKIVQPQYILAFGQKVYDLLQFSMSGKGIKIYQVHHYAYARRGKQAELSFKKKFRDVVQKCRGNNR